MPRVGLGGTRRVDGAAPGAFKESWGGSGAGKVVKNSLHILHSEYDKTRCARVGSQTCQRTEQAGRLGASQTGATATEAADEEDRRQTARTEPIRGFESQHSRSFFLEEPLPPPTTQHAQQQPGLYF